MRIVKAIPAMICGGVISYIAAHSGSELGLHLAFFAGFSIPWVLGQAIFMQDRSVGDHLRQLAFSIVLGVIFHLLSRMGCEGGGDDDFTPRSPV